MAIEIKNSIGGQSKIGSVTYENLNQNTVRRFVHTTSYGAVNIPTNTDLNTLTYCQINHYVCPLTATAATLTNCPTRTAFCMDVYDITNAHLDVGSSEAWVYLVRRITDISGNEWIQKVSSNESGFSYGSWKRIKNDTSPNSSFYETPTTSTTYSTGQNVISAGTITIADAGKVLANLSLCGKAATANPVYFRLFIDSTDAGTLAVTNITTDHFVSGSRVFDITKGTHNLYIKISSGNPNFTVKAYTSKMLTVVQL